VQPWTGFSLLTEAAASSSVWVLVKERRMQLQVLTLLTMKKSFQGLLTLPVLNHNPNVRTSVIHKTQLLFSADSLQQKLKLTYILIRLVAALSPRLTVQVFLPCRGRSNKKKKVSIFLSMDRDCS